MKEQANTFNLYRMSQVSVYKSIRLWESGLLGYGVRRMAKGHQRTPNDQRSDRYNTNSPEYKAMNDNRSVQIQRSKESGNK